MEKIVDGTDFIVEVELEDSDGVAIDPTTVDFNIYHFTNTTKHLASKVGDDLTNCTIADGVITCYIDAFEFGFRGQLKEEVEIIFTDNNFPDGDKKTPSEIILLDALIV